jgi:hypothetical protein
LTTKFYGNPNVIKGLEVVRRFFPYLPLVEETAGNFWNKAWADSTRGNQGVAGRSILFLPSGLNYHQPSS